MLMLLVMMRGVLVYFLLVFLPLGKADNIAEDVIRDTNAGKVRGHVRIIESLSLAVETFLGIPYATPPVGDLRFEPPRRAVSWSGVRNATELPPACWQSGFGYIQIHRPGFELRSEDCLYLNVYVPVTGKKPFPVMVHVHGGSNEEGMGAMLDGDILAVLGELVVVTFNYRLGPLGFFGLGVDGFRGNMGLMDQNFALQWVKANIKNFEGDPDSVTLQGHSSGSADVGIHLTIPASRGFFRYAIMQSGFPLSYFGMEQAPASIKEYTKLEASLVGCSRDVAGEMKTCLKKVSPDSFRPLLLEYERWTNFTPIAVDGAFVVQHPKTVFESGTIGATAVLMGVTADDGGWPDLTPETSRDYVLEVETALPPTHFTRKAENIKDIVRYEYIPKGLEAKNGTAHAIAYGYIVGDAAVRGPGLQVADLLSSRDSLPVYFYSFDYDSPESPNIGVPHGTDMFYLFGVPFVGHPYFNYTEEDKQVSRTVIDLWTRFIRTGTPRGDIERYTKEKSPYFRVVSPGEDSGVKQSCNLRAQQVALWNELLPSLARNQTGTCNNSNSREQKIEEKGKKKDPIIPACFDKYWVNRR